jgi:hypothetical protein
MATRTSPGNTIADKAEQIKQELAEATDLSKLLKNNKFVEKLKKLPEMEQLKIFKQYKDEFDEVSKDPGSAIAKWTGSLTNKLPNLDAAQKNLNDGIQQGQHFIENLSKNLK